MRLCNWRWRAAVSAAPCGIGQSVAQRKIDYETSGCHHHSTCVLRNRAGPNAADGTQRSRGHEQNTRKSSLADLPVPKEELAALTGKYESVETKFLRFCEVVDWTRRDEEGLHTRADGAHGAASGVSGTVYKRARLDSTEQTFRRSTRPAIEN